MNLSFKNCSKIAMQSLSPIAPKASPAFPLIFLFCSTRYEVPRGEPLGSPVDF